MHLKNMYDLVSTRLTLHNMYIIFTDNFWKQEYMQEATDEVHNEFVIAKVLGASMQVRFAVVNLTLYSLAGIDDNSREILEYIKQEVAMEFEIAMCIGSKTFKKLCARRNNIVRTLWTANTKICISQTFTLDDV